MELELITEESIDQYVGMSAFPNLADYPIKNIADNCYRVGRTSTRLFWGCEGKHIRVMDIELRPFGNYDGSLEQTLEPLIAALASKSVLLIHVENDELYCAVVPRQRSLFEIDEREHSIWNQYKQSHDEEK